MPGLYIHIPFCEKKCIYCSFYSIETFEQRERFLRLLLREIELRAEELAGTSNAPLTYETVFFGGGTPSLLSPGEMGEIMDSLRRHFIIESWAEITMECNPGALTADWLQGYRDLGVNRISFGVQSFDDDELRFLSRIHSADEARQSINRAREYFENVSLDLIFALPNQSRERWRANLQEGLELGTRHFSAYSLIFEEGTPLNAYRLAGKVRPAPDTLEADMYEETMETLSAHGFKQYEVSNYSLDGYECRHNIGYWERRSYIAFGPSAHGLLQETVAPFRWGNISNLTSYLDTVDRGELPVASREVLNDELVREEIIFLGLRSGGIILEEFARATAMDLLDAAPGPVAKLLDGGYAIIDAGRLRLTQRGYQFADRFSLELIDAVDTIFSRRRRALRSLPSLPVVNR